MSKQCSERGSKINALVVGVVASGALLMSVLGAGCKTTEKCRPGTVLVTIPCPQGFDAHSYNVAVNGAPLQPSANVPANCPASTNLEVTLDSYSAGNRFAVTVTPVDGDGKLGESTSGVLDGLASDCDVVVTGTAGGSIDGAVDAPGGGNPDVAEDGGACIVGTACAPSDMPCAQGKIVCTSGRASCIADGAKIQPNGASCGTDKVCSSGQCISCAEGTDCAVTGAPCKLGKISCQTGSAVCGEAGSAPNGKACGASMVCADGTCAACKDGSACVPINPCHQGTLSCSGATPQCNDATTNVPDGASCGANKVCGKGACIACTDGAACAVANPCRTGVTSCSTGAAQCIEMGNAPNGTSCGASMVCSNGICTACSAGASCTPANPCHGGSLSCGNGVPACGDNGVALTNGTACGLNKVCNSGACGDCTAGTACVPPNTICKVGKTSCDTGVSSCVASGNAPDGTSCGTGQVCSSGVCAACADGTACTPTNSCHTGKLSCASGKPVCNDTGTAIADGASCGQNLVCKNGSCNACTENVTCGTACKPGKTSCATGSSVCAGQTNALNGTSCNDSGGTVCNAGTCVPCTANTSCTNVCHTGTQSCSTGSQMCVDNGGFVANGTTCGSNLVCNAGSCVACTGTGSCSPPGQPCHVGTYSCATGTQVCVDTGAQISCPTGQSCSGGVCLSQQGQSCNSNNQCLSVICADGKCCDKACTGTCQSCSSGTCSPVTNADDPDTCHGTQTCGPAGTCLNRDGQSCTKAADCLSGVCTDYYRDADGDGFGISTPTYFCGSAAIAGYTFLYDAQHIFKANGDCCDIDPGAHPDPHFAMSYHNVADACGNFDWNCTGVAEQRFTCLQSDCARNCDTSTCTAQQQDCVVAGGINSGVWTGGVIPTCGQSFTLCDCSYDSTGTYLTGGVNNCTTTTQLCF